MGTLKYRIKICESLRKEKIFNLRIEQWIFRNKRIKTIKTYYDALIKRKARLIELAEVAKKISVTIHLEYFLANIDIMDAQSLLEIIEQELPFDNKRKKIIIKLAQTEAPKNLLTSLVQSKNTKSFDSIFDTIPPVFLIKHGLLKTKDFVISAENSIRALNTPMRD